MSVEKKKEAGTQRIMNRLNVRQYKLKISSLVKQFEKHPPRSLFSVKGVGL